MLVNVGENRGKLQISNSQSQCYFGSCILCMRRVYENSKFLREILNYFYLERKGFGMSIISYVNAREILDSRGNPTVEVEIATESQYYGRAAVPSGASTGEYEACELRDGNKKRYLGKGVLKAVKNVKEVIGPKIIGLDCTNQHEIDRLMRDLDGSENKTNLGANAILGVSLACAKAAADASSLPLYRYLGGPLANRMPVPLMNIINGGSHANNNLDFQEFMIVPLGAPCFREAIRYGAEVFHCLRNLLRDKNLNTGVGDEGGYSPDLESNEEALQLIMQAIEKAGYRPGIDISLALDVAASEFFSKGIYSLKGEARKISTSEMVDFLIKLSQNYPIISIEDAFDENDWEGFSDLTAKLEIGRAHV